jgi:negative regulator of sigma E activity
MVKGKVAILPCQINKAAREVASIPVVRGVGEVPAVWVANMVEMAVVEMVQAALILKTDRVINPRILNLKYRTSLLLHPGSKSNVLLKDIN